MPSSSVRRFFIPHRHRLATRHGQIPHAPLLCSESSAVKLPFERARRRRHPHEQLHNFRVCRRRPTSGLLRPPLDSLKFTSAPCASNARAASRLPLLTAVMSGVLPRGGPHSGCFRIQEVRPWQDCRLRRRQKARVAPYSFAALTFAFARMQKVRHGQIIAVSRQDQRSGSCQAEQH